MAKVIQFPSKQTCKPERESPCFVLNDSIEELVASAIAHQLIVSCTVTHSEVPWRPQPQLEEYNTYLVVLQIDGNHTHLEQPGYQLKTFLNGLLLGQLLSERGVVL